MTTSQNLSDEQDAMTAPTSPTCHQMKTTTTKKKKVIGIIGGSGPEAGADLFGKVLAVHRRKLGALYKSDRDAPNILLMSVADLGGPRTAIDLQPDHPRGTYRDSQRALVETVQKIAPLVDAFCLACNTLHVFEPLIRETLVEMDHDASKFVSMIGASINACRARLATVAAAADPSKKIPTVAILGGPATMDLTSGRSSYQRLVDELGPDTIHPLPPSATKICQDIIWQIKEDGVPPTTGSALEAYQGLLRELGAQGASLCVLACTELPLIGMRGSETLGMEFLNPTQVVAEALLEATYEYP